MTDPKIEIKNFALKEEQAARAWFGTNWVPVSVGIVIGLLVDLAVRHL